MLPNNWTQTRKIAWALLNQTLEGEVSMKKPIIGENSFPSLQGKNEFSKLATLPN